MNGKLSVSYVIFCILFFTNSSNFAKSAVTYLFSGGRFGDNLVAYLHAKYIAVKYKLDFLYKPFEYSNELELDKLEPLRYEVCCRKFKKVIQISGFGALEIDREAENLYVVPYFPEFEQEFQNKKNRYARTYFEVDWGDEKFYQEMVRLVRPCKNLVYVSIPPNTTSIALHVRKGGEFAGDPPLRSDPTYATKRTPFKYYADVNEPLKFPPDSFYIEQLKYILCLMPGPFYIYLFTDDSDPARIVSCYESALTDSGIKNFTFDFRHKNNSHNTNVLDDFFAMTYFDIIIRPNSNFSMLAFKLKSSGVEIAPRDVTINNNLILVTAVDVNRRAVKLG